MAERKRDWDVITGWEKRIKVDFGSIGPNHVRWSDWTYKERDIVARKVHESTLVSKEYGPRSRQMGEWAKENEPIMIGFSRDGGPMPDWAHADYRPSGVPEHVNVVWKRENSDNPTGDWAYDPPAPWDAGEEPAWSAPAVSDSDIEAVNRYRKAVGQPPVKKSQAEKLRDALARVNARDDVEVREFNPETGTLDVMEKPELTFHPLKWRGITIESRGEMVLPVDVNHYPPNMDELVGAVKSMDQSRGGWVTMRVAEAEGGQRQETVRHATKLTFKIPTSYDIENWEKAEFRFCFRKAHMRSPPSYILHTAKVPTPNLDIPERNVNYPEPKGSFIKWGYESQHGFEHQVRWCRMALAMGHEWEGRCYRDKQHIWREAQNRGPMTHKECEENWEHHNRNARWTKAMMWFEGDDPSPEVKEMHAYHNAPPVQGNFTFEEWRQRYGADPEVVSIYGWEKQYIIDPQVGIPLWGLDGFTNTTDMWAYAEGKWSKMFEAAINNEVGPKEEDEVDPWLDAFLAAEEKKWLADFVNSL